jgi:hypothetical protein
MFGLKRLEIRLLKVEQQLAGIVGHLERMQNEWRQTREEAVTQMAEIRAILRPHESDHIQGEIQLADLRRAARDGY